jgi:hypothetical protein
MKCPAMEMCLETSTLEVWQVQTQNSEKVLQVSTNNPKMAVLLNKVG